MSNLKCVIVVFVLIVLINAHTARENGQIICKSD